jgi:dienelactone hydrolase
MAELLLFHHAQGETPGFIAFADELRAAGHTVHAPDLYDGKTFATLDKGAAFPASEFGGSWPPGVPLQIHMMEADEWALEDRPAARQLVEGVEGAELSLYPGDRHLFADNSLPDYDEGAAKLLMRRVLAFLENVE